jgi:hypothetical protein
LGTDWRVIAVGSSDIYLLRDDKTARWQLAAAVHRGGDWRAEYRDFDAGLPRSVHLVSAYSTRFDLTLMLSHVALN